jgi:hypothetical protein
MRYTEMRFHGSTIVETYQILGTLKMETVYSPKLRFKVMLRPTQSNMTSLIDTPVKDFENTVYYNINIEILVLCRHLFFYNAQT